jgi:hypothetical protein
MLFTRIGAGRLRKLAVALDTDAGELYEVMLRTDGAAEAAGRQPGWGLAASAYLLPLFTQVIHSPCRATPKP